MQDKMVIRCVALGTLLLGLTACAAHRPALSEGAEQFAALSTAAPLAPEVQINAAVLAGELAARQGLREQAAQSYAQAAQLSADARVAARATQLALQAENLELATAGAARWIELAPEDAAPYEIAARLALRAGDWALAVKRLRSTLLHAPQEPNAPLIGVAEIISAEPLATTQALALYAQVSADQPLSAALEYGRALLAYRVNQPELALAAVQRALLLEAEWRPAQMLALRLHLQANELEQARRLIRDLHVAAPKDLELRLALGSLLLEHEQLELAHGEYRRALKIAPDNVAALFASGLIEMDRRQHAVAQKHFERLLSIGARTFDASYYLGQIAEQSGRLLEAMSHYRNVQNGRHVLDAAIRQVVIISRQGETPAARTILANLRARFPEQELRLYQVEAEVLYQDQAYAEAEQVYTEALAQYADDPDLLYGRAIVRENLGQISQAEADLRQIVVEHPDDARALNALGYILSNHSDRYVEATEYVRRALAITPDDPAVIDSMGWLLYRQGDLAQARDYLERAYAKMQDPEVAAHLGEVLWSLGERARAREIWRAALQQKPEHPVLRETVQRLDSAL